MAKLPTAPGKNDSFGEPKAQPFKEAVRQRPGMLFGGVGPNILPGIVAEFLQGFLSEDLNYRGRIDVECSVSAGQQRICITFHHFDSGEFEASKIGSWKNAFDLRKHQSSMMSIAVAALTYFRLESSNGRELATLTVTDKSSRAQTSRGSAGKY